VQMVITDRDDKGLHCPTVHCSAESAVSAVQCSKKGPI
jgi:hypothetical protein